MSTAVAGRALVAKRRPTPVLDLAFFAFVFVSAVGLNPLNDRSKGAFDQFANVGSQQYLGLYVGALAVAAIASMRNPLGPLRSISLPLWLLFGWSVVTVGVSVVPVQAVLDIFKQLAFILGVSSFFVLYRDGSQVLRALKLILPIILVGDVLAILFVPHLAIHQFNDATEPNLAGLWRGLHGNKGTFGDFLSLTAVVFYFDWRSRRKTLDLIVFLIAAALLLPSGSKVSLIGLFLTLGIVETLVLCSGSVRGVVLTLVAVPVIAALLLMTALLTPILLDAAFGDTTLAGRTRVWDFLWSYSKERPWFGSGFSSFFIGKDGPLAQSGDPFLAIIGNAHNSFLDMLVTIGWPGTILAIFAFLIVPISASYRRLSMDRTSWTWLAFVISANISGLTISTYLQPQRAAGLGLTIGIIGLGRLGRFRRPSGAAPRSTARRTPRTVHVGVPRPAGRLAYGAASAARGRSTAQPRR